MLTQKKVIIVKEYIQKKNNKDGEQITYKKKQSYINKTDVFNYKLLD